MFKSFKKEEEESMTEPLLLRNDQEEPYFPTTYFPNDVGITGDQSALDNSGYNYGFQIDERLFEEVNPARCEPPMFNIKYEKFPKIVNKFQRRIGGKSQQRLKANESQVILGIEVLGLAQVADVQVFVVRSYSPEYHRPEDILKPQKLKRNVTQSAEIGQYRVCVDLDSVFDVQVPGESKPRKIYGLAKNNINQANMFYLKVVVTYVDGSQRQVDTEEQFQIIGKDKKSQGDTSEQSDSNILPTHPVVGTKRPRTDTDESHGSVGSFSDDVRLRNLGPQSNASMYSNSSGYNTDSVDESVINAARIVADRIAAKRADIGDLIVARPVKLKGGDIAYEFILKNPDDHPEFHEGEIVGLFVNENGERVLDKLSHKNILDAVLKGVITRSQYLVANVQPEGVRAETICMFGIVPVQVRGPVLKRDIVYASPDIPGTAVSGSAIGFSPSLKNDAAAIGMAWETTNCGNNELNLVHCFVSITMEVFEGMMDRKITNLKAEVDSEVKAIHKARRKSKRRRIVCFSALTIFLLLLSILLWQVLMPGSAFSYWRCKLGSIAGHTAEFRFIPISSRLTFYLATGAEFSWEKLKTKTSMMKGVAPIKQDGFHYYYNIDRCAFGSTSTTEDSLRGKKIVGGPIVFAVDDPCKHAYYYSSARHRWCVYRSAVNLRCTPPRHYDHMHSNITYRKCF